MTSHNRQIMTHYDHNDTWCTVGNFHNFHNFLLQHDVVPRCTTCNPMMTYHFRISHNQSNSISNSCSSHLHVSRKWYRWNLFNVYVHNMVLQFACFELHWCFFPYFKHIQTYSKWIVFDAFWCLQQACLLVCFLFASQDSETLETQLTGVTQMTVLHAGEPLKPLPKRFDIRLTSVRERFRTGYSSAFTIQYRLRADAEKGEMVLEPWRKNDHDTLLYNMREKKMKHLKSHWMAGTQETNEASSETLPFPQTELKNQQTLRSCPRICSESVQSRLDCCKSGCPPLIFKWIVSVVLNQDQVEFNRH